MLLPADAGAWYALSLILTKVTTGTDDGNVGGYSNYKAAQVTMFDRINEDKRNGKRFNSYNTTWSVDQMVDFLVDHPELGVTLASEPRDGAHGARVRGCIFTPDIPALKEFHDARLAELKDHILYMMNEYKGEAPKAADSVAALF